MDKHAENYKERRTIAKNVNFGTFYGLFPRGLQKTLKFKVFFIFMSLFSLYGFFGFYDFLFMILYRLYEGSVYVNLS